MRSALSDIVLFGTESHVELAAAMREMAAGQHALVISPRNYIRKVLDLEAIPPMSPSPTRPGRPSASGVAGRAPGG